MVTLAPALVAAFFAGLLGAGHCFGMCGGIAGGLGAVGIGKGRPWRSALAFNVGRLSGYILLGGVFAGVLGSAGNVLASPPWGHGLRLVSAVLIALIGLQMLTGWRLLGRIERAGARVWKVVSPLAIRASAQPGLSGRWLVGLCWGFLPCGMVYTVLLTATATGTFPGGMAVMLAFGLGTLPALMGLTLAAPALATVLQDRAFRRIVGAGLVLLAVLAMMLGWPTDTGGHHPHHH